MVANDKYVLLYDVGGTQGALYNSFTKVDEKILDHPIYGACVSQSGSYALITRSDKYDSVVRVFQSNGKEYAYNFFDGRVYSASLSKNGLQLVVLLVISDADEIRLFVDAVRRIRNIEGDRKIIAVIEDIDNFVGDGTRSSSLDTLLLNILDGNYKMSNVVIIATTNYIERLESRYKNRPSRFDRVIEFPLPNAESRKLFIEKTILPEDIDKIDINKWIKKTDGYTIDHINELILLHFVYGHSEEDSFNIMSNMVNNNSSLTNKTSINKQKLGF
jgi:hypothetical protein